MTTNLLRSFLVMSLWLLATTGAHAEGGCPPGMYPFQFAPNQPSSCAPIPGNGNQQTPQAPPQQWERRWGAIATGGALGVATDKSSKNEASQTAMSDCAAKGGTSCKIDVVYDNQCAVVVAAADGSYNVGNAKTVDMAVASGMKTCRDAGATNCHTYYSACSLPVRVR